AVGDVGVCALAGADVEGARNGPAGGEALEEPLDEEVAGAVGGHQQLQVDARGENQGGSQPITDDTTAATRAWYGPAAPWPPLPSAITSLWPCCWAPRCEPPSGRTRSARGPARGGAHGLPAALLPAPLGASASDVSLRARAVRPPHGARAPHRRPHRIGASGVGRAGPGRDPRRARRVDAPDVAEHRGRRCRIPLSRGP